VASDHVTPSCRPGFKTGPAPDSTRGVEAARCRLFGRSDGGLAGRQARDSPDNRLALLECHGVSRRGRVLTHDIERVDSVRLETPLCLDRQGAQGQSRDGPPFLAEGRRSNAQARAPTAYAGVLSLLDRRYRMIRGPGNTPQPALLPALSHGGQRAWTGAAIADDPDRPRVRRPGSPEAVLADLACSAPSHHD